LGWKAAVEGRLADHRQWMGRLFMLLCSAVVIRMIGGLATVAGFDALWLYPLSAWASWLVPLVAFELSQSVGARQELAALQRKAAAS
jgi:hypothetical protein